MSSHERYKAKREADYQAKLDVEYEVWRSGGDPDAVDRDMVQGELDQGYSVDEIASMEMKSQRRQPECESWDEAIRDMQDDHVSYGYDDSQD